MKRYLISFWFAPPSGGFGMGNIQTIPLERPPTFAALQAIEAAQRKKLHVASVVVLSVSVLGDED